MKTRRFQLSAPRTTQLRPSRPREEVQQEIRDGKTNFTDQDLSRTDLRNLTFSARDLSGSDLSRADVHGARFYGADLWRVDLSGARGLSEEQFGGACLDSAVLPEAFSFQGLHDVRELSGRAERTLLVLVVACVTTFVVAFVHEPVQLFRTSTPVVIPGIGMQVPLAAFYVLTPLVLLGLHLSLVFTLRKLCYALSDLPVVFPNGRAIDQQVAPTSPNFAVLACPFSRFLDGSVSRPEQEEDPARNSCRAAAMRNERWFTMGLIWGSAPLTLLVLWLSYLPRHDLGTTLLHTSMLSAAVGISIYSHHRTNARFRFRYPRSVAVERGRTVVDDWMWVKQFVNHLQHRGSNPAAPTSRPPAPPYRPSAFAVALLPAVVALGLAVFSSWVVTEGVLCSRQIAGYGICGVRSADLERTSLDSLHLHGVNLVGARLTGATLRWTKLEGGDLSAAELSGASLLSANLKDADLTGAIMQGAVLDRAKLREATLDGADLRGASLRHASLQGASFAGALLNGVTFDSAIVCGAKLGPGEQWPSSFHSALGADLAEPPLHPRRASAAAGGAMTPAYLIGRSGADEYPQWYRAWRATDTLRQYKDNMVVDTVGLFGPLAAIDLSMARSTQRQQDELVRDLRRAGAEGGTSHLRLVGDLAPRLRMLRDTVRAKAKRHCVDTGPDRQAAGPAGSSR